MGVAGANFFSAARIVHFFLLSDPSYAPAALRGKQINLNFKHQTVASLSVIIAASYYTLKVLALVTQLLGESQSRIASYAINFILVMSSLKTKIVGKQSKVLIAEEETKRAKEETKRAKEETKRVLAQERTKQLEAKARMKEEKTRQLQMEITRDYMRKKAGVENDGESVPQITYLE